MSQLPPTPRRDVLRRDDGFTIVELLVTVLIIGILAAILITQFTKQPDKGKDSAAQSAARNLQTHVEGCAVETAPRDYTACNTMAELSNPNDVVWGPSGSRYTITAVSRTAKGATNSRFSISRAANGALTRTCTTGGAGNQAGQCRSGVW